MEMPKRPIGKFDSVWLFMHYFSKSTALSVQVKNQFK